MLAVSNPRGLLAQEEIVLDRNAWWTRYVWVALLLLMSIILFTRLGSSPLQMQWEPNYGQVVREMVWGEGDLITPTSKVGGDEGAEPGTFWSKPILIFWMAYPFNAAFGPSEWSMRLPIALTGLFGVMMTYWFMSRLFTRRTGLLSALMLGTSPSYFLISRAFMVDVPFVVFMWVAVGFLLLGEKEGKARWYHLFYVFMGLSSLAKGLTPLVLVGGTVFGYCLVSMDWGLLKRMRMHTGAIIYLVVAAPWYTYMGTRYGMPYLKKFFWDHHVERSLGKLDKPNDTFEMFVLYFSVGVLPWITFLPMALFRAVPWAKREADKRSPELFFLMGFIVTFTFFCVISTKFVHYIFPAVPYTAILIALYLDKLIEDDRRSEINRLILFAAVMVLLIVAPDLLDKKNYRNLFYFITTERLQDWHPNVADPSDFFSVIFVLWGLVLAAAFAIRRFNRWILGALVALSVVYAGYITMVMIPTLEEMFSARGLIQTYLTQRKDASEPIAEFTQTWKSRSIKFYIPFDELKDKYDYRHYRLQDNDDSVRRFYQANKNRRVFIIIEQKQKHFARINALWQQVSGGEQLVKIADDAVPGEPYKPEFWLVSNRDNQGHATRISMEEQKSKLAELVHAEPFTPAHPLSVVFDNQIELVGYDELPAKQKTGQDLHLTLYFKALKNISKDWQIFVHAERDKQFRLLGDHVPAEGQYPTSRWQEGQYIKDSYSLEVPEDTSEGRLDIMIGLFSRDQRAPINKGDHDAEGRVHLATVELTH